MAKAGAIRAGRAFVEIFADKSKLVRGLDAAGRDFKAWGRSVATIGASIAGVGAGIVGTLTGFAVAAGNIGGQLVDTSAKTGLSVEALSTLGYAAAQTDVELEAMTTSVGKMQKQIVAATGGSKSAQAAFTKLGLSAASLAGMSTEEQFLAIGDALSRLDNPAERAAAAMAIFGKSGAALLPMFAQGAAGVRQLQAEARRLGIQLSTVDAEAMDKFGDTVTTLGRVWNAFTMKLGAAVIGDLQGLADSLIQAGAAAAKWVSENKPLVALALKIGAGMVGIGGAVVLLGGVLSVVGSALSGLATVLPVVGGLFTAIGAAVGLIATPIGAVVAAIGAAAGAFLYFSGIGGQVVEAIKAKFATLAHSAGKAFEGIKAALQTGDLGAAAAIGFGFLKVEFFRVTLALKTVWSDFLLWFKNVSADAWSSAAIGFNDHWEVLKMKAAEMAGMSKTAEEINLRRVNERNRMRDANAADKKKNAAERDAALAAAQKELTDAERNLSKAIDDAKQKAADQARAAARVPGRGPGVDRYRNSYASGVDAGFGSTSGTFRGATAGQALGAAGRVQERIAKATEETAEETAKVNRNLGALRVTFK